MMLRQQEQQIGHVFRRPITNQLFNQSLRMKVVCVPLTHHRKMRVEESLELKTAMMIMFFTSVFKLLTTTVYVNIKSLYIRF